MSESRSDARSSPMGPVILVAVLIAIITILIAYFTLNQSEGQTGAEISMTPRAGGVTIPAERTVGVDEPAPTQASPVDAGAAGDATDSRAASSEVESGGRDEGERAGSRTGAEVTVETPTAFEALKPGRLVVTGGPDGSGASVYAAADPDGLLMSVYADGTPLVILEPSGESGPYPVKAGGTEWYRVRTPDGLVGWVMATSIAVEE